MASSVEFQLFAPYNNAASLIGSFSEWQDIPMQKDDQGYFRVKVDLEDGIYHYKFRVQSKSWFLKPDEWVEINDPYMKEMDKETDNGIVHVQAGQLVRDTYTWQHDDVPLPQNHELVIYEMHIADFANGEIGKPDKFTRAIAKLDHLKELGVNAIELMPLSEYQGDYRWGYLVSHYFAPESSYGSPEDLKRLIDECHARGIRVFMDGIYNHTDDKNPLLSIDRDYWYYHDRHYPEDDANYWGPEFNYDRYDPNLDIKPAWKFIGDVVRFWIQEYHIDGIRFDAVRQLAHEEFLHWITQEATNAAGEKPFYNIAEYIPDTATITCCNQGPMDSCWHESFRYFVMPGICGEPVDLEKIKEAIDGRLQGYGTSTNMINYLASHDRERTLVELGDRGIFDEAAFARAKFGATLLLTALGIPMIWMGDEFGECQRKADYTTDPRPLNWSLLEQDRNQDLFRHYKHLIALREKNGALQTDNLEFFHENPESQVLAYVRWHEIGAQVVVIANFSDQAMPGYAIPGFPEDGQWQDWFNQEIKEVGDRNLIIDLDPYSAKVLVKL